MGHDAKMYEIMVYHGDAVPYTIDAIANASSMVTLLCNVDAQDWCTKDQSFLFSALGLY